MLFDSPIPFKEALAVAKERGLLPTTLDSEALRQLEASVKRRAVFSARMDRASVLQVIKDEIAQIVSGEKDADGRLRSIPEAKARIRESLFRAGVPLADDETPAIQDFYSDTRLKLIVETQVADTLNHGRWVADQDEDMLDAAPAQELVRVVEPLTRGRDWKTRWDAALRASGDSRGATSAMSGRMVALKNHPIWQALGDGAGGYKDTLGNPWPPFAFNSGMNVVDVLRDEAEALGLLRPGEQVAPSVMEEPSLGASLTRYDDDIRRALASDPDLRVVGGKVVANEYDPNQPRGGHNRWIAGASQEDVAAIGDLYDNAGTGEKSKVSYRKVDAEEKEVLLRETGLDLTGYEHEVTADSVRHFVKNHGDEAREAKRGQRAVTREDVQLIPEVTKKFDRVSLAGKDSKGLDVIRYEKKYGRDTTVVLEEVRTGKKKLVPVTMYIQTENSQAGNDAESPLHTSENERLTEAKIARMKAICKTLAGLKSNTPHSALRTPHST